MAYLLNRAQQIRVAGVYPISAYTRVVGFFLNIPDDAAWHFATTPVLGQRIWLLRVTIRHCPRPSNPANYTSFEIMTGRMRALTLADIGEWEHVIPNIAEGGPSVTLRLGDGCLMYEEYMSKLYIGDARRFGILARRFGTDGDQFFVTWQIAEG